MSVKSETHGGAMGLESERILTCLLERSCGADAYETRDGTREDHVREYRVRRRMSVLRVSSLGSSKCASSARSVRSVKALQERREKTGDADVELEWDKDDKDGMPCVCVWLGGG